MQLIKSTISSFLFILLATSSFAQMNVVWADTLDKALEEGFQNENMNGLVGAVVFSDGSVWSGTEGNHFNMPLSTDFLYDIGSNTKSMVAAVILLLEEEGKLKLSDSLFSYIAPVNNVIPWVTIEQLLNHRSGTFNFTEHPDFYNEMEQDESKVWHPDSILSRFVLGPTTAQQFRYSNTGYLLLGKVIEAIENKPLNMVFQERIYQPLGIDKMFLAQYDMYTNTKTGAWLSPGLYYPSIESFLGAAWAAGGIVTQPEDFAIYAHKLLRGDLLSDSSMQKMRTGTTLLGGDIYGLGIIESEYMGHTYLGHGGTTLQNSEMEYSLESDFSLILVNLDNGYFDETRRVRNKFLELLEYIEEENANMVSTNDLTEGSSEVQVYPNPSSSVMNIESKAAEAIETYIEVKDLTGKLLLREQLFNQRTELYKNQLGQGLFLLNVYQNNELIETRKIVFH
jgi:D-alanyl-D-alanine carboxypeptidase